MDIRRMGEADIPEVARLYLKAYEVDWNEAGAQKYLGKFHGIEPESCFVAIHEGKVAGAIMAYSYERETGLVLFIQELFVDPEVRNAGTGKKLIAWLRDSFTLAAKVKITPLVKADTNVLNFYNSLGFERDRAVSFMDGF
ncbi:MAG: GNAT family N-acetyltransferase [Polyangiaceae bacterium]|nr:GNAT family N-acetyltransferase [Polyangiaceae bacterium]MCB9609350.1 GNAT family N-acetyltransferase [Polyangiaceae bacterium]